MNTSKKLYNVKETGQLIGIGKLKVYELIKNGYLKALDIGGLKVPCDEIDRFINEYSGYSFMDMENVCKLKITEEN